MSRRRHRVWLGQLKGDPFTVEHFERFAYELILDSGERWRLEKFQAAVIDGIFRGAGENWFVVPEGNAKTTLTGGLGIYGLRFSFEEPLIPVAASSRDQARILYRQAKGFLRRSNLDEEEVWFECFDGYRRIDLRTIGRTRRGEVAGSIEIHAADAGTADGVIPFPFAFIDELHRHKSFELYETWRGKLIKRGAQLIVISTAGEAGSEFEERRQTIRRTVPMIDYRAGFSHCRSDEIEFHEYALEDNADPNDVAAVKRCNPLAAITEEELAKKLRSPTLTLQHWVRFNCNRASRPVQSAITEIEWDGARTDEQIPEGESIAAGLDVAWKWDTTALVPFWFRDKEFRLFGTPAILEPPRDGSTLDPARVETVILELHARNPLHTVVMDTTMAEQLADWIRSAIGATVIDRSQGNALQAEDYERFMDALRNGWLKHTGDPVLRRHVLNAMTRLLPNGKARFYREKNARRSEEQDSRVIDALTAAAMVHCELSVNDAPGILVG